MGKAYFIRSFRLYLHNRGNIDDRGRVDLFLYSGQRGESLRIVSQFKMLLKILEQLVECPLLMLIYHL